MMLHIVTSGITKRLKLQPTTVLQINIEMPNKDKVYSSHMLIGEIISLGGQKMVVGLIVINMFNFDIILGMDILSRYGVEINYKKKKV